VVAARDLKHAPSVRKNALLNVLDPGPVYSHRDLVLGLARHRAGVTPNALAVINYKAVFHPPGSSTPKTLIIRGLPIWRYISEKGPRSSINLNEGQEKKAGLRRLRAIL
jgi:hypothetical protein